MTGRVVSLSRHPRHGFSKTVERSVRLIEGEGVQGDAHAGTTVKHRSRVARDPSQPNLRQVHLLQSEVLADLNARGFPIAPGALGENLTTHGIDLLALPSGTRLHLGDSAVVEVTGLRNPCRQIEDFHAGLLAAVIEKDAAGHVIRKTGVMAIVLAGGVLHEGDPIRVELPAAPHRRLEVV